MHSWAYYYLLPACSTSSGQESNVEGHDTNCANTISMISSTLSYIFLDIFSAPSTVSQVHSKQQSPEADAKAVRCWSFVLSLQPLDGWRLDTRPFYSGLNPAFSSTSHSTHRLPRSRHVYCFVAKHHPGRALLSLSLSLLCLFLRKPYKQIADALMHGFHPQKTF